jgi:hypothetical protein
MFDKFPYIFIKNPSSTKLNLSYRYINMIDLTIKESIFWILFIMFFWLIILSLLSNSNNKIEHLIDIPSINRSTNWGRTSSCKYLMNEAQSDVLLKNSVTENTDGKNADILFPCGYNDIDAEIASLPHVDSFQHQVGKRINHKINNFSPKRVLIIDGADQITAKNYLWKNLVKHHGLTRAKQLQPNTYLLVGSNKMDELARLKKEHYEGKLYILKKNVQRQTGLEITNDLEKIETNLGGYVLAQELLMDPYILNGRKINLRVYIFVVCNMNKTDVYMFNDGFMYYNKQNFVKDDPSMDNNVTTGYVERDVYVMNPLTHTDFKKYLDLKEGEKYHPTSNVRKYTNNERMIINQGFQLSNVIFKRIENLFADVFISFKGDICREIDDNKKKIPIFKDYSAQIFGADVAINDQLQAQIIEINKGPDLSPKDERDGTLKKKMVRDCLSILGIVPKNMNESNGFIRILEM